MKRKRIWVVASIFIVLGLLMASFGCAPAAAPTGGLPTGEPGALPTKVEPAPEGPWDSRGYYPLSMEGKTVDIIQLLAAHPVEMNIKQGELDENEKYGFTLNWFDSNVNTDVGCQ